MYPYLLRGLAVTRPDQVWCTDECVYLNAFETGSEARQGIGHWIDLYNSERPHSAHAGATPEEVYTGLKKHSERDLALRLAPLSEFPLLAATRTAESTLEMPPSGPTDGVHLSLYEAMG